VQAYLKKTPYQLDLADNGKQAFEKFAASSYDLVLMDMQMPVLDGYSSVRAIRQWENENGRTPTPIIALTAYALKEEVARSLEAGCTRHLTKPIKKEALLRAIEQATSNRAFCIEHPNQTICADQPLAHLVPGFLRTKRQDIEAIQFALRTGDFERIKLLAHNMKGEGTTYGFPRVSEIGAIIEQSAESRDQKIIAESADELAGYLSSVDHHQGSSAIGEFRLFPAANHCAK
jgi:CheY-like chemotaxis protein/HPt (histidine-containing phosphotransfer) domain-containing protein